MKQIHIFTIFLTPKSFFDGQFKYLTEQGHEIVLISSFDSEAEEFAKRNKIRYIPVEMPRALSPNAILKAIKDIKKIIRDENPDAVFGHTPVGALCAMIAAKQCGVKNRVYYRHGVIYTTMSGLKRIVFKKEEQFVSKLATHIINVSHSLSKLALRDQLNNAQKQYVIGHGTCGGIDAVNTLNPELLNLTLLKALRSQLHVEDNDVVFGFCGRICIDKGIPEMVSGFEMLKEKHRECHCKLLLIGTMDDRDILPKETKSLIESDEDIIVTGWIEKKDIPYYYSILDTFVFPSHREGFGMCVIEASSMGKPVLVSKVHGCEDTIVDHLTGEYIELSPESICNGMEKMLHSETRLFLGKSGREKVLEWYDFKVMWPLVDDLYKKILR